MRLVLAGGTGFIGTALRESLTRRGHEVVVLTRQRPRENQPGVRSRYAWWNPPNPGPWERELDGVEGVLNLAGEPIVGKRWTESQKQKITESRTGATRAIVTALQKARKKPSFLLNASAVGYYGPHGEETLTEESPPGQPPGAGQTGGRSPLDQPAPGRDFLAQSCQAWEAEALKAGALVVRVIRLRIGIVLEKKGGALGKMLPPFQLGLGGPLGTGRQWMSWIHRDDLIELIHFVIGKKEVRGVLNGTAPNPVTMKEFSATLGRTLGRPAIFPMPAFMLKLLLGEMADMLLTGQRVLPKRALDYGFSFKFPELGQALKEILTQ